MITLPYLRSFRIAEYAIFDLVASFIGVYLLAPLLSKLFLKFKIVVPLSSWLYFTLPLGIIIHLLVGNMTGMTKDFIDPNGHFVIKIIIVLLTIIGIKGIKKL